MAKKHVYGPVPSRRLGRSLGVDLVPYKVCSYDCIYCQLGRTTDLTCNRREYVDINAVLKDLREKLKNTNLKPDYISLAGSGEPTLNSRIGELIAEIKNMTDIPVAVLTNGSLLWMDEVKQALLRADLVMPSLDCGDEKSFVSVNRPHREITFKKMLKGLIDFAAEFKGKTWLEVFLIDEINSSDDNIKLIAKAAASVNPDRIQLNTVARPPADRGIKAVSRKRLEEIQELFPDNTEIIASVFHGKDDLESSASERDIMEMLLRRPCTLEDISVGLNLNPAQASKILSSMEQKKLIKTAPSGEKTFYIVNK